MGTIEPLHLIALLIFSYGLGSIPFGLLLTRLAGAGDLRAIGSGNIGATNVLRTGRKGIAAATLLLDMGKGAAAVCIARLVMPELAVIAGFAAFLGHCYPVWLRFNGGKGVATMLGVSLGFSWPLGLCFAGVWIAMLALSRLSSLSGMSAAVATTAVTFFSTDHHAAKMFVLMAIILMWKHRENLMRIKAGTEPKVGATP